MKLKSILGFGVILISLYSSLSVYRTSGIKFSLSRGITAKHFQGDGSNLISWIQKNIYFEVYSAQIPLNELKNIARSMVNESPITRNK